MNLLTMTNTPDWQAYCQNLAALSTFSRRVDVLRLDQIHPWLSGNKPLKLQGWLDYFQQSSYRALLSFGGAHSNHLHALAYAAKALNVPAYLVVRAYKTQRLTPTLTDCLAQGAELIFADRAQYARRYDSAWQTELAQQYQALVIGEGGEATQEVGALGELGCYSLANIAKDYQQVWLAIGSGTTALGLAKGLAQLKADTEVVGVNAVADQGERRRAWQKTMPAGVRWQLIEDAHLGGFAKTTPELKALIARYDQQNLPLDPVYTGKMLLAFERQLHQSTHQRILLIHSGGLQGRRGVAKSE